MSEIRNLTRNGETFYPLTHIDGIIDRDNKGLVINDIFDISEYNASGDPMAPKEYSDLGSALSDIPLAKQKPGMTIRFIESTNRTYLQYRLMSSSWSTVVSNWQGIDEQLVAGSHNLVESVGVLSSLSELGYLYFEKGGIDGSGTNMKNAYRARSSYVKLPIGTRISVGEVDSFPCSLVVFEYASAGDTICVAKSNNGVWVNSVIITTTAEWIRIAFKFDDTNHEITDSDLPSIKAGISIIEPTEQKANRMYNYVWDIDDFEQGNINPGTGANASSNLRIRTKARKSFKAGDKINFVIDDGQKVVVGIYKDSSYTAESEITSSCVYTVSEDCEIRLVVYYNNTDAIQVNELLCYFLTSGYSSTNYLLEKQKENDEIISATVSIVDDLEKHAMLYVWMNSDFEWGTIDASGNKSGTSHTRLRTVEKRAFKAGDRLFVYLGNLQVATVGIYYNGTYTQTLYTSSAEIVMENDCEVAVVVRWEDASKLFADKNENGCIFLVNSNYAARVFEDMQTCEQRLQDEIDACEKRTSYQWAISDFEQGNIINGNPSSGGTRIRTKNRREAYKDDIIYIETSNNQAVKLGYYTVVEEVETYKEAFDFTVGKFLYKIEQDCEIVFVVRNQPDGTTIRPADYNNTIILYSSKVMNELYELEKEVKGLLQPNIVVRNSDKETMLVEASINGKKFQLCLASDVHNDQGRFRNAVLATEGFDTIKCLLSLGDMVNDNMYSRTSANFVFTLTEDMQKPSLMVLGNHDVGNSAYLPYTINKQEAYDIWMRPFHERNILNDNENPVGTCHWYKDFVTDNYKVRIIGLNCYDEDIQFDETNWRPIPYDSSYPRIQTNTTYSAGDKVNSYYNNNGLVNYTEYSFEAVHEITTGSSTITSGPAYKCKRGTFVIGEAQANWFANTLATVPEGYGVVIALHGTFSSKAHNQSSFKFADDAGGDRWANPGSHYMMETDFLAEVVETYKNRGIYNKDIVMNGTAAYMNTQGSGTYAYHINKDFSNAKGTFMCWLGGHWHADLIWKHDIYKQYQISPTWTNQGDWYSKQGQFTDIVTSQKDDVANDCLTTVAFNIEENKVGLVKIGQNITTFGKKRDIEIISNDDIAHGTLGNYYGKKIILQELMKEKHQYTFEEFGTVNWIPDANPQSITSNWLVDLQSTAIFGGYVFNWLDHGNCLVMDLATGVIIGKFDNVTPSAWHNNNAQFSNIYYDSNDEFPLCLVSDAHLRSSGAECAYVRIQRNDNDFTFTVVQNIIVECEYGVNYGTFVADWMTNKLYMYCYEYDLFAREGGVQIHYEFNPTIIVEYELPAFASGSTVTLDDSKILNMAKYPTYRPYAQGGFAVNGKVFIAWRSVKNAQSYTNEEANAAMGYDYENAGKMIAVFAQGSLDLESFIQVGGGAEMEGLCLYDGKMYLTERIGGWTNASHETPNNMKIYRISEFTV